MAFADDKKEWRRRVRAIKDTVHIQETKEKGEKKRQRISSKKTKSTKRKIKKGRAKRRRCEPQKTETRRARNRVEARRKSSDGGRERGDISRCVDVSRA